MLIPIVLVGSAVILALAYYGTEPERPDRPDFKPDVAPGTKVVLGTTMASTGYSAIDKILGELKKAADSSQIPLGLLVGWLARESGGRLAVNKQDGPGDTTLDERGYFQLMPSESKALGLDHKRLSTDSVYSINSGLLLIGRYMAVVDKLGVALRGSSYFVKLTKLVHSMGQGAVRNIVEKAKAAGQAGSWDALSKFALGLKINGPQFKKWGPFVNSVYAVGRPYGWSKEEPSIVGYDSGGVPTGAVYTDIPDPLDIVAPRTDSPPVA